LAVVASSSPSFFLALSFSSLFLSPSHLFFLSMDAAQLPLTLLTTAAAMATVTSSRSFFSPLSSLFFLLLPLLYSFLHKQTTTTGAIISKAACGYTRTVSSPTGQWSLPPTLYSSLRPPTCSNPIAPSHHHCPHLHQLPRVPHRQSRCHRPHCLSLSFSS